MDLDHDILGRTLYGEARGEWAFSKDISPLIAVGNVIMNRLNQPKVFGKTLREVCLKPYQFSCWNKDDPNYQCIQVITAQDKVFALCLEVSENLLKGILPDLTYQSDHYHADTIPIPSWATHHIPKIKIGHHLFYSLRPSLPILK